MHDHLVSSVDPPTEKSEPAWWFIFTAHMMIVEKEGETISVPFIQDLTNLGLRPVSEWYLGTLSGHHCYCAEVSENISLPAGMVSFGLRYLYGRIQESLHKIAMKASHILEWDSNNRYCGRCRTEMKHAKVMRAKECPGCGFLSFPRISPAIIVLIERENKVLLARVKRFTADLYSVLAGFVEPGETLEEAAKREIEEEVGIRVKNIQYFGSQPWPFPDSLMIGFTAEYESGEIMIDETEISDAGWFDPEQLPTIPGKISIARQLIDWFVDTKMKEKDTVISKKEREYVPHE
ncbi:MAG TPA: NAD(+) diphosphatase [Syntrophaceae bacterium]|jgi:NAD+ diphosphatase|nr:NAD(+) diphosphatase [Syntrophaceae bacterium]